MSVYMTLGDLPMELLSSPTAFARRSNANYAEHALIGRKAALHLTGFSADEITISIRLHHVYCSPAEEAQKLEELKNQAVVFPVVFATGEYHGTFVLKSTDLVLQETAPNGAIMCCELNLTLGEYVGDPVKPNPPGLLSSSVTMINTTGTPLPAALAVPAPANFWSSLQTAAQAVEQVGQAVDKVNTIVAKAASGDVLGATALAGSFAPQLTEMANALPVEAFQSADLEPVKTLLVDAGTAAQQLTVTRGHMNQAANLLQSGSTLSAFSSASDSMGAALASVSDAGPALARMDAYVTVGCRLAGLAL